MALSSNPVKRATPDKVTSVQPSKRFCRLVFESETCPALSPFPQVVQTTVQNWWVWGEALVLKPCVGCPGDGGAFCPLHQTSVVFMQRWDACWDRQSGPMAFGLSDTKISFRPPPTSRSGLSLCFALHCKRLTFFCINLCPRLLCHPGRFMPSHECSRSVASELSYFRGGTMTFIGRP